MVRLTNHVNGRIEEESNRNDPIWNWASKNLPLCAAYMILARRVKFNFIGMREEDSLLPRDTNNFIPYTRFPNHHGVYLQHDTKLEQKVRLGRRHRFVMPPKDSVSVLLNTRRDANKISSELYRAWNTGHTLILRSSNY